MVRQARYRSEVCQKEEGSEVCRKEEEKQERIRLLAALEREVSATLATAQAQASLDWERAQERAEVHLCLQDSDPAA